MTEKQITEKEFKNQVSILKQHEFDAQLQKVSVERDRFKRRYDELLESFEDFKSDC